MPVRGVACSKSPSNRFQGNAICDVGVLRNVQMVVHGDKIAFGYLPERCERKDSQERDDREDLSIC
jgi:hypothetical protein